MELTDEKKHVLSNLWALPEARPSAADLMEENDWARVAPGPNPARDWARRVLSLRPAKRRSLEWYLECNLLGNEILKEHIEINPRRAGGVPVLTGTRFTVAQVLAELARSSGVSEVADNYDLDPKSIEEMLNGLSLILMRSFSK
jgi:uncharacterized protein (DUF433 family)